MGFDLIKYELKYERKITKRSFKTFNKDSWNVSLAKQDWSELENCGDVDEMGSIFDVNVLAALNEVAPIKTFTIKSNHKFGLSESTSAFTNHVHIHSNLAINVLIYNSNFILKRINVSFKAKFFFLTLPPYS